MASEKDASAISAISVAHRHRGPLRRRSTCQCGSNVNLDTPQHSEQVLLLRFHKWDRRPGLPISIAFNLGGVVSFHF